jgi:hypothetical protein
MTRIVLDEEDFRRLVSGLILEKEATDGEKVWLVLSDLVMNE